MGWGDTYRLQPSGWRCGHPAAAQRTGRPRLGRRGGRREVLAAAVEAAVVVVGDARTRRGARPEGPAQGVWGVLVASPSSLLSRHSPSNASGDPAPPFLPPLTPPLDPQPPGQLHSLARTHGAPRACLERALYPTHARTHMHASTHTQHALSQHIDFFFFSDSGRRVSGLQGGAQNGGGGWPQTLEGASPECPLFAEEPGAFSLLWLSKHFGLEAPWLRGCTHPISRFFSFLQSKPARRPETFFRGRSPPFV